MPAEEKKLKEEEEEAKPETIDDKVEDIPFDETMELTLGTEVTEDEVIGEKGEEVIELKDKEKSKEEEPEGEDLKEEEEEEEEEEREEVEGVIIDVEGTVVEENDDFKITKY